MSDLSMPRAPLAPLMFGAPERSLFGLLHAPAPTDGPRPGILVCKPFGQEGIRSHRLLRVLAERLARQGHPVLRFDAFGTGDAGGDDDDVELGGWAGDVLAADAELRRRSGCARTVWVGMRLGATVALQAAAQAPATLARVVAWDTVLDGPRYLEHLRRRHVASLALAFSLPLSPSPEQRLADPAACRGEAIGFSLPPRLREQLAALAPAGMQWPAIQADLVMLADPDDADGADLATLERTAAARWRRVAVRHGIDWTRDSADNTALVPAAALMALVEAAGAPA